MFAGGAAASCPHGAGTGAVMSTASAIIDTSRGQALACGGWISIITSARIVS